jgi:hypothetical protein
MRTYGKTSLRTAGATSVLAMIGLVAALIPLALHARLTDGADAHWSLYLLASVAAGGAIGWVLKR